MSSSKTRNKPSEKPKKSSVFSKKRAISFEVIFACLTFLVIAVMAVTWYTYKENSHTILELSQDMIDQINQRVIEKTTSYLSTAVDMTELSSRITKEGVVSITENQKLDELMVEVLRLHDQLTMFYIGNERGEFLMQKRNPQNHKKNPDEPAMGGDPGTFSKKIISIDKKDKRTVRWIHRDDHLKPLETYFDNKDPFDPRTRPWYKGALEKEELYWSDVYIFTTGKVPGVTASYPVGTTEGVKGVFGLDIPLYEISKFLSSLKEELATHKIGNSVQIFIMNSKGDVVAFSDPKLSMIEENGKLRVRKVEEVGIPQIVESYKNYKTNTKALFRFEIENEKGKHTSYISSYRSFPEDFGKDWIIGLVVLEDALIGEIKETNRVMITIAIVILGLAIILGLIMLQLKKALDVRNRFIRETFGRYLTDEVVESILETPEGAALGGEKRILTIMMTDLRGFTSIGERLPAESVVGMINIYLDIMTDIIFKYNGTIDEFIGDAILVIFGAPILRDDDAKRAVACALEMQIAMEEVNRRNKAAGYPEVAMGIGLNTGEVVVGNIGSSKRTKYGVVGKNVNLTSRVESYTVGGQILISESTLEACGDLLRIDDQMQVMPKGVNKPITISEVGGISGSYNIYLPDKNAVTLDALSKPLSLDFTVLAGKHASDDIYNGLIKRMTLKEAEIETNVAVEKLNNIKITLVNGHPTDMYAKVVQEVSHSPIVLRVNFTSLPPESRQVLEKLHKEFLAK